MKFIDSLVLQNSNSTGRFSLVRRLITGTGLTRQIQKVEPAAADPAMHTNQVMDHTFRTLLLRRDSSRVAGPIRESYYQRANHSRSLASSLEIRRVSSMAFRQWRR